MLCHGLEKTLSECHDCGRAWAQHGMCESNMATLCKSNGKNKIYILSSTAWQGNSMGMEWYV
jgi:hypothetical protein